MLLVHTRWLGESPSDLNRYVNSLVGIERMRGELSALLGPGDYGSDLAAATIVSATAASMRLSGLEASEEWIDSALRDRTTAPGTPSEAAALGYAELLRLVMDRHAEVPFLESQIKYFHSLLLRHDADAASHRRAYRRGDSVEPQSEEWGLGPAPPGEDVAAEMSRATTWARESLDAGDLHPLAVIAIFLFKFVSTRPFVDGNGRLARALATYLLLRSGYDHIRFAPLEAAIESHRSECASVLRRSRADATSADATDWIEYFLELVAASQRAARDAIVAARATPAELPLHPRRERLLALVRERGAVKIGDILAVEPQPRATLKKDLRGLIDAGYLATTGIRKGTIYRLGQRA